jgi:phage terminase large subunit-like protein
LFAEVFTETPGALWTRQAINECRRDRPPRFSRIVIGVDPAVSSGVDADEHGIIASGIGNDGHGYVLADASTRGTPDKWGSRAVSLWRELQADSIVAEANQGGDMVRHVIHGIDPSVPVRLVHATRGKMIRAEPVSALYEQGRVHHCGMFPILEDQMCSYTGEKNEDSPDHLDAMVWSLWDLMIERKSHSVQLEQKGKGVSQWQV